MDKIIEQFLKSISAEMQLPIFAKHRIVAAQLD